MILVDQEKIWRHFQGARVDSFGPAEPRYEALVREAFKRRAGHLRVLNIGIGGGGVERRMLAAGWSVMSLDPDSAAVTHMKALGVDARQGYAQQIPVESDFVDVVIVSEVLEHIADANRRSAISEIARILKPDGLLIGTVPYRENLSDWETVCPTCGNVFHRWGHVASFDGEGLRAEVAAHFNVLRCSPRAFVDWRAGKSLRRLLRNGVRWILGRMGEGIVYPSLFFVARKVQRERPQSTSEARR